jgi:hypothetical protein
MFLLAKNTVLLHTLCTRRFLTLCFPGLVVSIHHGGYGECFSARHRRWLTVGHADSLAR